MQAFPYFERDRKGVAFRLHLVYVRADEGREGAWNSNQIRIEMYRDAKTEYRLWEDKLHHHPMKQIASFILSALVGMSCLWAQMQGPAKYVVLVSIDGFRPDFYLEEKWPTPNLKALARQGIQAEGLRPVVPSVTLPDHITMITGALPARHGVYHNRPFDPKGWRESRYIEASQIKAPTLWEAVQKAGGKAAALRWPVSLNAPVDFNFTSASFLEGVYPTSFLKEIEENVTGSLEGSSRGADFDYYRTDLQLADITSYLIKTYQPNLITVHFSATDHFQHEQGREGDKVHKAIAVADVCVGQLVEATKAAGIYEETAFVIVGDHGFEDRHTQLAWNSLLIKEGLLSADDDRGDWKACFHDQFLYLRDRNDQQTLARVRRLLEEQPPNIRKLYRIVERDELDSYGVDPEVVLAVQPIDGVVCTTRYTHPDLLQSTPGGSHGLIPDRPNLYAGFLASGPGLRSGMTVPSLGMEDIAPHIAFLLGIEFDAPDGILYPGLIAEELIEGY